MGINQAVELAPHDPEIQGRVGKDFQRIEDALTRATEHGPAEGSLRNARDARELDRVHVVAFPCLQVMMRAGGNQSRLNNAPRLIPSNLDCPERVHSTRSLTTNVDPT